ncbi:hypothetical protein [Kordia jejudonensis]|uniref:hypothetical protein n=1 Tax=Kordia jejudonensis TaxID=1348245 RepID=UPI0012E0A7E7|nr:hypothetical protein [Kordia jejudonensis]
MKKLRINTSLQLKKSTISDLQTSQLKGGLPTTQQSTVLTIPDIPLPVPQDPRPMTISYSNCGNCTSWKPTC